MRGSYKAGLIAAMLGLASLAPLSHVTANETIDPVTTGTVSATTAAPVETRGSAQFRSALGLLADGDAAGAFAAARALTNPVERQTIEWAAVYFHSGAIPYDDVATVAVEAADFAPVETYRTRIEQSLATADADDATVIAALGSMAMPQTIDGQIRLARAYLAEGEADRATSIAKSLWVDNFLTTEQEAEVLTRFGALLDREAHWQRAMHLMMHDRARGTERLMEFLSDAQKSLVVARAAVSRNDDDAKALLDAVDASMHANPVYIYSRAQRARQFELWQSAVDWLNQAPEAVPDAAEWWYERRTLVRKLLDVGQPKLAYEAAAGYTNGPDGRLVEARFHAGWIALSFLKDASAARDQFTAMTAVATLPDSITQANYWLARANLALGDVDAARAAFEAAARYGTVYYGQLARAELGQSGVDMRPLPDLGTSAVAFEARAVVQAIHLLEANDKRTLALPLLRHLGTTLTDGTDLLLAARLAETLDAHNLAITIANRADQQGTPLDSVSFPKDAVLSEAELAADRAAVFAIMRQESMFQVDAVSSAGARGLMQLMPGTAQEVARAVGLDYSPNRLVTDAAYNALLGSTYLNTQLERYDGSLVLAAAAYNAGPGNANKWIRAYGDPRADNVDPVIWVELIPFQETRTYVKRVLGNYLVYREQLGDSEITLQQALRTIN